MVKLPYNLPPVLMLAQITGGMAEILNILDTRTNRPSRAPIEECTHGRQKRHNSGGQTVTEVVTQLHTPTQGRSSRLPASFGFHISSSVSAQSRSNDPGVVTQVSEHHLTRQQPTVYIG